MAKEAIKYYRVGDFALENLGSVGWPEPHILFCLALEEENQMNKGIARIFLHLFMHSEF